MADVIQVQRSGGYTVLPNGILRDTGLSLKTKGLFAIILSPSSCPCRRAGTTVWPGWPRWQAAAGMPSGAPSRRWRPPDT